jgi:hypothetical protein
MSAKTNAQVADSVWPAVERAIRNQLPRPELVMGVQVDRMTEWFAGEVIRQIARELDSAGVRVPDVC